MSDRRTFIGGAARACLAVPGIALFDTYLRSGWRSPGNRFDGGQAGRPRVVAGVSLRWCPPGRFTMGSPLTERGRRSDERQVSVTLTRGFWVGQYEVTQAQWHRFMDELPTRPLTAAFGLGDRYPVYWISHDQAQRFCVRLTAAAREAGELTSGEWFQLPTEAQWEYACRAGTSTATAFGDDISASAIHFGHESATDPHRGAVPVGRFPANAWGARDAWQRLGVVSGLVPRAVAGWNRSGSLNTTGRSES